MTTCICMLVNAPWIWLKVKTNGGDKFAAGFFIDQVSECIGRGPAKNHDVLVIRPTYSHVLTYCAKERGFV